MADVLQIQVHADRAGMKRLDNSVLRGASGVEHHFAVVAKKDQFLSAFEVLEEVGETEVMSAHIKALDTNAQVVLVSSSGRVTKEAKRLAAGYCLQVVTSDEIPTFFEKTVLSLEGKDPQHRCETDH